MKDFKVVLNIGRMFSDNNMGDRYFVARVFDEYSIFDRDTDEIISSESAKIIWKAAYRMVRNERFNNVMDAELMEIDDTEILDFDDEFYALDDYEYIDDDEC